MADPNDPWADDARPDDYADGPAGHDPTAGDGPHADLGTYASDREVQADNPKKAVGTGVKILVGLLVAGGAALLVCCGAGWFWISSTAGDAVREPQAVRARTEEILTVDIPDTFNPTTAAEVTAPPVVNWFFDFKMDLAGYETDGGGELLVLRFAGPQGMTEGADPDEVRMQVESSMRGRQNGSVRVNVESSETRTYNTADGRGVDWQFIRGAGLGPDGENLGEFRQVRGTLIDGDDVYILSLAVPEEEYDEAAIVEMLRSIRLVNPKTEAVPADAETPLEDPAAEGDVVDDDGAEIEDGEVDGADGE